MSSFRNRLSWLPRCWRDDIELWLKTSSPETYQRALQEGFLEAHLTYLLQIARERYATLRRSGYPRRIARRLVESELAAKIGHVAAPPVRNAAPVTTSVPEIPRNIELWQSALEDAWRLAAPESYAEAQRRGIVEPHLENVLHWARQEWQSWANHEHSDPICLTQLFQQARLRAIQVNWDTPCLHRDPQRWPEDLIHHLQYTAPERTAMLARAGQLRQLAEEIASQLRRASQNLSTRDMSIEQWFAFARAALIWSQHPWHELTRTQRFTSLTVDIVGSCNARCPFCPRVAMPVERSKGFMDFELFRRILQRGREHQIDTIYLYSTGEPTLHPRFDDFVALAKDLGYFVVCSTNGSMMHQHRRGLRLADSVQLSIEGWDRVSYERYRYPLRFERVYANVQEYAAVRPAQQRYVVNCLLTRKTDVEQYALLWGQFFDEIVFHPMYPTAGIIDGQHRSIPEPRLAEDYWSFERAIVPVCSDPFQKLTIAFDGKRLLCCQDFSASLPLGHADDDWNLLYHNTVVEKVRRELRRQTFETCQQCGNLVELPAAIKAAFLAEISRVWRTHTIRAQPNTAALEIRIEDPQVAAWLRHIVRAAVSDTVSETRTFPPNVRSTTAEQSPTTDCATVALPLLETTTTSDLDTDLSSTEERQPLPPTFIAEANHPAAQRVLVLINEVAEFTALAQLAQHLRDQCAWHPILYFTEPYPLLTKHVLRCRQWRLPVYASPRVLRYLTQPYLFDNSSTATVELEPLDASQEALLQWCLSLGVPELPEHLAMLRREQAYFRQILAELRPQVLVLGQENVSKFSTLYSHTALQQGIPSVIVPWCLASQGEFLQALAAIPLYHATTASARAFCQRFPRWCSLSDQPLLRAPVYEAAALEILGCAPENPWAFQSGFASALAVESPWMMEHYRREGVPEHRLRLTGSWCDDDLHSGLRLWHQKREELCKELHLDPNRPILLAALPSNQMNQRQHHTQFNSYPELLTFWVDTLASLPDCQTVFVMHPSFSQVSWRALERETVRFSDRPTYELMPLADALIACVSSIIRWALACGLPVIDFDVYRFGYTYFRCEPQVRTVENAQEFKQALHELVKELRPGQHVPADGIRISPWGLLDGQSTHRISALLRELASSHQNCPATFKKKAA
ncbi:MAG: radical SAM protein [Gemmatales bacterium]|nr:radical SAM protein [Gemmatales bacterium]MDW7994821.1 radical SAM protein [Gemmatales bacterium]